jgi:hypothetical protein
MMHHAFRDVPQVLPMIPMPLTPLILVGVVSQILLMLAVKPFAVREFAKPLVFRELPFPFLL